jgi:hypothetical protein
MERIDNWMITWVGNNMAASTQPTMKVLDFFIQFGIYVPDYVLITIPTIV